MATIGNGILCGIARSCICLNSIARHNQTKSKQNSYPNKCALRDEGHSTNNLPFAIGEQHSAVSTKLWKEHSAISDRIDFLPLDSDEYKTLHTECDAKKAEYEAAHIKAERWPPIVRYAYFRYLCRKRKRRDCKFIVPIYHV